MTSAFSSAAAVALAVQTASQTLICSQSSGPSIAALPALSQFIASVAARSRSTPNTLGVSIVFLDRVRRKLPATARGLPCSTHRLFLAAIILASKAINDKTYKNKSWVSFTEGLFPVTEINLMERQFLSIVDFDLSYSSAEHQWVSNELAVLDARIKNLFASGPQASAPKRASPVTLPPIKNFALNAHTPVVLLTPISTYDSSSSPSENGVRKPTPVLSHEYISSPASQSSPMSSTTSGATSSSHIRFHPYFSASLLNSKRSAISSA